MEPTPSEPYDLSPRAAAAILGVHPATLKLWARANKVHGFVTVGGHWRFRRSDIDAFAERSQAERVG